MEPEQDLNSEITENVPQDQEVEQHAEIEQETEVSQEKPTGPSREHFRRLEQSKRELEQRLKLQEEMMHSFMRAQPTPPPVQEAPDELDSIADDDFISKGKVKALVRKEAMKIASEVTKLEQEKFIQRQHQSTFMSRLKGQFQDFDDVVNPETLALLEQKNPELAQTIADSKDPYKIGLQSYSYIKAMSLHKNESPRAKEVERKLEKKTVPSPQAYSKRPMAQAFNPNDERDALYAEMNQSARRSGYSY